MQLPRGLFPLATAIQIVRILSRRELKQFTPTAAAKTFSSSTRSSASKVSVAKIPTEILSDKLTATTKDAKSLIINSFQIKKYSSDFWNFLKKEKSANADIASIVKAIEEFRTGKTKNIIFEGGFQKTDFVDHGIETQNLSIDYSNSVSDLKKALEELGKQNINLRFIQIVFDLCGFHTYDMRNDPQGRPFAHALRGRKTQIPHCDGLLLEDKETGLLKPAVDANALFATLRKDRSEKILTSLIDINDIAALLSEETKKILQKPFFYNPSSLEESHVFTGAHPILYFNEIGQLDVLYPKGSVIVHPDISPQDQSDAKKALEEFEDAIFEAEKNQGFAIELEIDPKKDAPKQIAIITGIHRRVGYPDIDLSGVKEVREIVAVTAAKNGKEQKTQPTTNPTLPDLISQKQLDKAITTKSRAK